MLDCPELPLNVSRSYLQSDAYVRKVAAHIVKKVADKLCALFNNDRAGFEGIWNDVRPYIEYGCMRDEKFYDRVKDVMLFKDTGRRLRHRLRISGRRGGGDAVLTRPRAKSRAIISTCIRPRAAACCCWIS